MSLIDSSVMQKFRWFETEGLYMAIVDMPEKSLIDVELSSSSRAQVPDLLDAMLLAEHDPLLQCLEAWVGADFDWKPAFANSVVKTAAKDGAGENPEPSEEQDSSPLGADVPNLPLHLQTDMPRLTVSLSSLEGAQRTVYLALTHEELLDMPSFPELWQSLVSFKQHLFQCEIGLQSLMLSADDWAKLEPGAMVLLENSFLEQWQVTVHTTNNLSNAESFIASVNGTIVADSNLVRLVQQPPVDASVGNVGAYGVSVRLQTPLLVNELYINSAWQYGQNVSLAMGQPLLGADITLLRHARDSDSSEALHGQIMQIGRGYGVLLSGGTSQ